jgi:hypothetical protein
MDMSDNSKSAIGSLSAPTGPRTVQKLRKLRRISARLTEPDLDYLKSIHVNISRALAIVINNDRKRKDSAGTG